MKMDRIKWASIGIPFILIVFCSANSVKAQNQDTSKVKTVPVKSMDDEYMRIIEQAKQNASNQVNKNEVATGDTIKKAVVIIKRPVILRQDYIGFSTAPLMQQLLPFNAVPAGSDIITGNIRRYKNNKGYRFGFGANMQVNTNSQSLGAYYDTDNRRSMGGKWYYYIGYGVGFEFFQENKNQPFFATQGFFNFLVSGHWGVEYKVSDIFSLSTEATFQLGLGSTGGMRVVPPVAIFANFNITKAR